MRYLPVCKVIVISTNNARTLNAFGRHDLQEDHNETDEMAHIACQPENVHTAGLCEKAHHTADRELPSLFLMPSLFDGWMDATYFPNTPRWYGYHLPAFCSKLCFLFTVPNAKIHSHREDRDTYLLGQFQLLALSTYPGTAMGSGFSIEDDSTNGTATIDVEMFKKLKSDYEAKKEGIEPKITLSPNSFAPYVRFSSVC
jgi:hypothetical protein